MPLVTGTAGADALQGTAADDTLRGLGGDDTLRGLGGRDAFDGGPGFDTADFGSTAEDLDADLAAGAERALTNSAFVSIEALVGGSGDDALAGDANANRLDGGAGDDLLSGGAGDDTLAGGAGDDVIDGGAGYDVADMGAVGFRGAAPGASAGGAALANAGGGTDFLAGVEMAYFADGRLVMDADDAAAQVARLYQAALDRLPDQGGLNYWIDLREGGEPLATLAGGFAFSQEFVSRFGGGTTDAAGYVDRLYANVLGRGGDAEGRAFWIDSLERGGAARADVLVDFSESAENKAGTAGLVQGGVWDRSEAAAEVARLYDTVLGRLPEVTGLAFWKGALEDGRAGLDQVADAFARSVEFRAAYGADLTNRQFADALYRNALDRAPEASGLDYWTGRLDAGEPRLKVVLAFSESAEHVATTEARVQSEDPGQFGILFA